MVKRTSAKPHLGCIDVAKLPSRQSKVSRCANPHFYLRSSSVEDLPQYSVAQVCESDISECRIFAFYVVCLVSAHVRMSYPGLAGTPRLHRCGETTVSTGLGQSACEPAFLLA